MICKYGLQQFARPVVPPLSVPGGFGGVGTEHKICNGGPYPRYDEGVFPPSGEGAMQFWSNDHNGRNDEGAVAGIVSLEFGYVTTARAKCPFARCDDPTRAVRRVQHESEADNKWFWFFESPNVEELKAKISPTRLKWEQRNIEFHTPASGRWPRPSLGRTLLVKSLELIQTSTGNLPSVRAKPFRREAQTDVIAKGEFETSAAFELRRAEASRKAEQAADAEFAKDMAEFEREVKQRQDAVQLASANARSNEFTQTKVKEAWESLWPELLGNPVLTDVQYNADKGEFEATLVAERGGWSQKISAPVPIADAPRVKQDLLSGKIAPEVTVLFPSMAVEWVLVENAAQRAKRFDDAKNSIPRLEALIAEFPSSKDAVDARSLIFALAKTPKELVALIEKYTTWNESKDAKRRLPQLQKDAYQRAVQTGSSSAYKEFLDGFAGADPSNLRVAAQKALNAAAAREERERRESDAQYERDRPLREARNLCQAQVNTCIASCPRDRVLTTQPDTSCESRCKSVRC